MENKRGQVTIFIIVAIIVVALAVLFYMISPRLGIDLTPEVKNPVKFIETCIEEDIEDAVEIISLQGGSYEPEFYFTYNDVPIRYLCYTAENYRPCVLQKIALEEGIEEEIENLIQDQVDLCFNSLKDSFEEKGYEVNLKPGETRVELLPKRIITTFNYTVILTKAETEKYEEFNVVLHNNLYELIKIGKYIVEWERSFGGIDPFAVMERYNYLDIDKGEMDDGTVIYNLKDKKTGGVFQLATRSYVFPPGF